MHIPDNYLSPQTNGVLACAMIPVWAHCARRVRRDLDQGHLAFLGVAAAFSFLLMMFNVPLPGGTTGHAVGGTLVALLLGPEAACVAVSVALALQALLFGDGGVLAFGANCFNMAFVLPFVGYGVYRHVMGRGREAQAGPARKRVAMAVGAWCGINAATLCAAVELGIQPALFRDAAGGALFCPYPLSVSVPAMCLPCLLVAGAVEATATVGIYEFVRRTAPGCIVATPDAGRTAGSSLVPVSFLVLGLAVATPLGLLAQGDAWGEWGVSALAERVGAVPAGMEGGFAFGALMPDYSLAGLPAFAGYALSAVIGAASLVIAFKLLSGALGRTASDAGDEGAKA
jgi:cobalt/nickel transport system permease protein